MASSNAAKNSNDNHLLAHVTERWDAVNQALEHLPKLQNKNKAGVQEEEI